ncbi:MAG: hypothetical protein KF717_12845 [Cyclobacteriaceae bacterium]|nr:hypothetical protein [Cyclobacteriaceae bacterium]MCB0499627.1 hypothetical protein [Cyclobacteriaceae bacterium]MCW5902623.1 hypothetical protein [Cyclobacteriaceae bacterium]
MEKLKGMPARSIGPAAMSGRITAIDVVANDRDVMYVGSASGGLWKSTSGGVNWEPVFDKEAAMSIGAVAIQQSNPSVVWVGTGEGNPRNSLNGGYGLYKSLDGGKSWKLMGLEKTRNIYRIVIDPQDPNTVYVGAIGSPWGEHPERGVFKTTDGGQTWEKILYVNERTGCAELVMDPTNPNKLFAAMWEHRRWPWVFKSGGPGSGLYVTYDGGKTWDKRTDKDGLPSGDLGRIGIAISAKPEIVYALVESKKNGLYKSEDGGFKWKMVNEDMDQIGDRPFYYGELHADPKNENRLYTIFSVVNVSEDGGKSFHPLLSYSFDGGIHPDHHAWWIHPDDPSFMMDGNDGGLNITHDMGKHWRFVENIPVGQFYHINVDMAQPYNVYGGMQDNGSWVGPAYVWRFGGIRNSYFQMLMFGDGFDMAPDPDNNRYGYGMSQEGYVGRWDRETGYTKNIRPTHPDADVLLRFNWNAAFAQDPFDHSTIYFGSQFVHKSTNKGDTWEIISKDLTTNDPEKQKQYESGGLTMDATGAENHCTILTIAPSPKEQGVIWAGTDDGQVQLTRDGGKTWSNLTARITGMPKNAWVPQIQASTYNKGEAFVVVNNYRQFDFKPYLFRTKDYGQTWESMVNSGQMGDNNYVLSVVQDPVEARLVFVGTENGLFVSLDEGKSYTKWTSGYPAALSTMDMVIHPREHDLVIGTFGRAIYVLDDIRPLREMARDGAQVLDKTLHVFTPPDAYSVETLGPEGALFPGTGMFSGENRPLGALISYVVNKPGDKKAAVKEEGPKEVSKRKGKAVVPVTEKAEVKKDEKTAVKYDSILLEIFNAGGEKIRTLKRPAPKDNGLNRMTWNLDEKGARNPSRNKPRANAPEPGGATVLAGTYKLRLTYGDQKDSTMINVKNDPRYLTDAANLQARYDRMKELGKMKELVATATDRLRESKGIVEDFEKRMNEAEREDLKDALDKTKAIKDSINKVFDFILGAEDKRQGITSTEFPSRVSYINTAMGYTNSSRDPLSARDNVVFGHAQEKTKSILDKVNAFYREQWQAYKDMMGKVSLSPFKDYEPLDNN